MADGVFGAFIERHEDVAAEGKLGIHGGFGGEGVEIAIEVRLEDDALIGDLAQAGEAEDLKSAGIGEDGVGPGHEAVEAAHLADEIGPGADIKMIGIGEQDFDAEVVREVALVEAFDRGLGTDGHENRGLDGAVGSVENARASAGGGALGDDFKGDGGHGRVEIRREQTKPTGRARPCFQRGGTEGRRRRGA